MPIDGSKPAAVVVARDPMLTAFGTGHVIVGTDIRRFSDVVQAHPLTVWQLGGESLGRPAGLFSFLYPRAFEGSAGTLHLLWAEPASPLGTVSAYDRDLAVPKTVWSASYRRTAGWSSPEKLYESRGQLYWSFNGTSFGNAIANRVPGLAVSELGGGHGSRSGVDAVLFTLTGDRWRVTHVLDAGLQASLASPDRRTRYLAYVRAGSEPGSGPNNLFVRASFDEATAGTAEVRVQDGAQGYASAPHLHVDAEGGVHLVWLRVQGKARFLRHLMLRTPSLTPTPIDEIAIVESVNRLETALDTCGTIHVTFQRGADGDGEIHHVTWRQGWSAVEPIPQLNGALDWAMTIANGKTGVIAVLKLMNEAKGELQMLQSTALLCRGGDSR